MLRYAITDRCLYPGDESTRRQRLIQQAVALANEGVDYLQLREKDLDDATLLHLTRTIQEAIGATRTLLILNGPQHVAEQAGVAWHRSAALLPDRPCQSCSVHTLAEVEQQRDKAALLLFAPVFEKAVQGQVIRQGAGLAALRKAVEHANGTPVLALGGITEQNTHLCLEAGAAGIAAIRLFLRH